jgi:hypothetical protein
MLEKWVAIKGYEDLYEISNRGMVRSLLPSKKCRLNKTPLPKMVAINIIKSGYCYIHLYKNGLRKSVPLHILVGNHFLEKPSNFVEINHKDGNKKNCCANNLEWITHSENSRHAFRLGLMRPDNYGKITRDIAQAIRLLYPALNQYELANNYGISQTQVWRILNNVCWKE